MEKDYYRILGVDRYATREEITRAYRSLARMYHPDLNPGDRYRQRRYREVLTAYEALCEALCTPKKKPWHRGARHTPLSASGTVHRCESSRSRRTRDAGSEVSSVGGLFVMGGLFWIVLMVALALMRWSAEVQTFMADADVSEERGALVVLGVLATCALGLFLLVVFALIGRKA